MVVWDIARALRRVQGMLATSGQHKEKAPITTDEGIRLTAETVGAGREFVREHLALLEESEEILVFFFDI